MSYRHSVNPEPVPRASLKFWINERSLGEQGYANNSPLTKVLDLSGHGLHVTQASSGFAPVYAAASQNGLPTLNFGNTATKFLSGAQVITGTVARSIYLVLNPTLSNNAVTPLDLCGLNSPGNFFAITCECGIRTGGGGNRIFTAPTSGVWQVWTVRMPASGSSAQYTFRINGTALTQTALVAGSPNTSVGVFSLGASANAGPNRYEGSIAEVLIYQANHSDTVASSVETYLRHKWGF